MASFVHIVAELWGCSNLSLCCAHREVALKVAAAVSQEALSSGDVSSIDIGSKNSLEGRQGKSSNLTDIESHLRKLQYDPFGAVSA